MFKIPPGAIEDPELLDHIDMLIKEILTSQRSNVKQKVCCYTLSKVAVILTTIMHCGAVTTVVKQHQYQIAHISPCQIIGAIRIL
jgi:hypothetical protein